jgi:hypothetical protein
VSALEFHLSLRRAFWWTKRIGAKARFRLRLARFSVAKFTRRRVEGATFVRSLVGLVAAQALYALGLCGIAIAFDRFAMPCLMVSWGMPLRDIDASSYVASASAIAQTMGVFLGLYFTAIGVVVGGAYGRVATDVRQLAIRERISDRYLAIVALACMFGLYLCGLHAAGFSPLRTGLAMLYAIATFAVFGFVQLGLRVYHFLDPEVLAARINLDVYEVMQELHVGRPRAEDRSFQAHHRGLIEKSLATYGRLLEFVNSEPPNLVASKDLLIGLVGLLGIYTSLKSRIPAGSAWYRPRHEYESILASSDDTFVTVHLATATMPLPRIGQDYLWFEKAVAALVADKIALHIRSGDALGAYEVLEAVQSRLHAMAKSLAVEEALLLERAVSTRVLEAIDRIEEPPNTPKTSEWEPTAITTQLCDFIAFAPMQILLGFSERTTSIDPHVLVNTLDWQRWFLRKRYYQEGLPRPMLVELDDLRKRLDFERSIEDRVVTGEWYLRERYAVFLLRQVTSVLEPLLARIEAAYHPVAERLTAEKRSMPAMHVALRGLETSHKFGYHLDAIATWSQSLFIRQVHDESAVALPDVEAILARVDVVEKKLLEAVQALAFAVYDEGATDKRALPDYFGHAYMLIAATLFARIRTDAAGAETLFRAFFGLSMLAQQRLGSEITTTSTTHRFTFLTEPYVHLAELSGYAYLYSQLQGEGRLWRSVTRLWTDALKEFMNPEAIRIMFVEYLPVMRPWYTSRFNWKRTFADDIAAAAKERQWFSPLLSIVREKILFGHGMDFIEARDVFYLVFLRQQREFRDGKMPPGAESLAYRADRMTDAAG